MPEPEIRSRGRPPVDVLGLCAPGEWNAPTGALHQSLVPRHGAGQVGGYGEGMSRSGRNTFRGASSMRKLHFNPKRENNAS